MKSNYFFVLAGTICISLCVISLNLFYDDHDQNFRNEKLVKQFKLDSKYKIVTVPMPNKDSQKFIINQMPSKIGQVVLRNLSNQ